jgi:xylulokinase
MAYLLGFDIGSSSVKATLVEADGGRTLASATSPEVEMEINVPHPGWAEQDPVLWWEHVKRATAMIRRQSGINPDQVAAIGISYQMHGLVIVNSRQEVLRPAIIWCDSRAVEIGAKAFRDLGETTCLTHFLNSPGNFTASKLRWVRENEPHIYRQIHKAMLPGEYIAMRLTGKIQTTSSGLSEGIYWDYPGQSIAQSLLDYYQIAPELLPEVVPLFSRQGELTRDAAAELGLKPGTVVSYRAGDQPNNAFSLKVLHPGEIAATAGTSGVVYGICDRPIYDPLSRVNSFVHVNHSPTEQRYGVLLCVNGAAILNRWLRNLLAGADLSYREMDQAAAGVRPGSDGLRVFPYGNGAERTLENKKINAFLQDLDFNVHSRPHLLRAAQEGIVFALNYGIDIMREMGISIQTVKAGNANMFLSPIFREAFANTGGARLELYRTDGSQGAARGAGIGAGIYRNYDEAFQGLEFIQAVDPDPETTRIYQEIYQEWKEALLKRLS